MLILYHEKGHWSNSRSQFNKSCKNDQFVYSSIIIWFFFLSFGIIFIFFQIRGQIELKFTSSFLKTKNARKWEIFCDLNQDTLPQFLGLWHKFQHFDTIFIGYALWFAENFFWIVNKDRNIFISKLWCKLLPVVSSLEPDCVLDPCLCLLL